jgi:hypothetical protein
MQTSLHLISEKPTGERCRQLSESLYNSLSDSFPITKSSAPSVPTTIKWSDYLVQFPPVISPLRYGSLALTPSPNLHYGGNFLWKGKLFSMPSTDTALSCGTT